MDWIKLSTELFNDEKVLLLQAEPSRGTEYVLIWIRLLCLAGKQENDGVFRLRDNVPYEPKQLATIFQIQPKRMKDALDALERLGMVRTVNGFITIPNWEKHQGTSESRERYKAQGRERQRRYMERQRRVTDGVSDGEMTHTDKDLDKDLDIDKEKVKKKSVSKRTAAVGFQQHNYTEADFGDDFYYDPERDIMITERNSEHGDHGTERDAAEAQGKQRVYSMRQEADQQ